jgi:hypothetical protein
MTLRPSLIALAVICGLLVACTNSPNAIGRMTPQQITTLSNNNLCYAYDHGQDQNPAVKEEVASRSLNCGRVLLQAGIEPAGAARVEVQKLPPQGNCEGIEFLGVFYTDQVLGIRGQLAKVRNQAGFTKIVSISFFEGGTEKMTQAEVKAGDIASIQLAVSDHPVSNVRITSCR